MMAQTHDRGGWPTDEPIDRGEHELMDWEWQTHALQRVLVRNGIMTTDEMRRGIESLSKEEYQALSYYEKWSASIEKLLVEKGVLTRDEIDDAVRSIDERWGA